MPAAAHAICCTANSVGSAHVSCCCAVCSRAGVEALKALQIDHEALETKFRAERNELEAKYEKLYCKCSAM